MSGRGLTESPGPLTGRRRLSDPNPPDGSAKRSGLCYFCPHACCTRDFSGLSAPVRS
jgi:hypothetical protein